MIDTVKLLDIISGRTNNVAAKAIRAALSALTPMYRAAVGWRNRKFDRALARGDRRVVHHASVPVISVGNLTTGGTGKTPFVIWLARWLRQRNIRVAILSRGYGSTGDASGSGTGSLSRNDEAIELEFQLPDVPHLQSPHRAKLAEIAVEELETQLIVLDDGFQHRQLHRDLDIVLIDATNPFGYARLLPRGLLREPIASLRRAQAIVLTRCELVTESQRAAIVTRIRNVHPTATVAFVQTRPAGYLQCDGRRWPLEHLERQSVWGFCGIGNPAGFEQTLIRQAVNLKATTRFADHHAYTRADLEQLAAEAKQAGSTALVCTHKDLVKVGCQQVAGIPVYALMIETDFLTGLEELQSLLIKVTAAVESE